MSENRKLSINFYLVIILSLIAGFLYTAVKMHGIVHYKEIFTSPYAVGFIIGFAIAQLICGFIFAILINFIFNLFRKEKKSFSYFWVWLYIIVATLAIISLKVQQIQIDSPQNRALYKQGCIEQAKATAKFQAMSADDQAQALPKINAYCDKAVQQYFQIYDQCMQEKHSTTDCVKQAEFEQCMSLIKPDEAYCNLLIQQTH